MESVEKPATTPLRRSARIIEREKTPEPRLTMGPRALMLLNKSKQNLEQSLKKSPKSPAKLNKTEPANDSSTKKRRGRKPKQSLPVEVPVDEERKESPVEKSEAEALAVNNIPITEESGNADMNTAVPNEENLINIDSNESKTEEKKIEAVNTDTLTETKEPEITETALPTSPRQEKDVQPQLQNEKNDNKKPDLNGTPNLLDESIISIADSPMLPQASQIKDSTFSPEVDTSIQDSRPHIDIIETTPVIRNYQLRTSTPLSQKLMKQKVNDLKISKPVLSALTKILSPKLQAQEKIDEESLSETLNSQFKMVNPMEKSILKSSRRKRSMSVADGESFAQKKVMFLSPKIMDIDTIDEKMLQSFREEKENSMLIKPTAEIHRRKRSYSECGTPFKQKSPARGKMPNFRAIHEQQFKKMESIQDHVNRKAERAKKLATPTKTDIPVAAKPRPNILSKIPKFKPRQPLVKNAPTENASKPATSVLKRFHSSNSLSEIPTKIVKRTEPAKVVIEPKKVLSEIDIKAKPIPSTSAPVQVPIKTKTSSKVEDRREKNMSLYKGKGGKPGAAVQRNKNENMLKGVRLNKRFELMMKHRQGIEEEGDD